MQHILSFVITNTTLDETYFIAPTVNPSAQPDTYFCRDILAIPRKVEPEQTTLVEYCYSDKTSNQPSGTISVYTFSPNGRLKLNGTINWREEADGPGNESVFVNYVRGNEVTINVDVTKRSRLGSVVEVELTDFVY